MEEESWRRNIEEESWRRNHGGDIIDEESWRRNHGGDIIDEESWRRNHGGGSMEEESWRRHLGALWRLGWPWGAHGAIWAWEVHFAPNSSCFHTFELATDHFVWER